MQIITSRRVFLAAIALGAAGSTYFVRQRYKQQRRIKNARRALGSIINGQDYAPLGKGFVRPRGESLTIPTLLDDLEAKIGATLDTLNDGDVVSRLMAAIEADLDQGDVVEVDGWVIARTSAVLSALCFQMSV